MMSLYAENNEDTTIELYAKWLKVYKITYAVDVDTQYCTKNNTVAAPVLVGGKQSYKEGDDEFTIELPTAYYKSHYFVGWTYEGQDEPVKAATVTIPKGTDKDLTFTAHYIVFSTYANTDGVYEVLNTTQTRTCTITLNAEVDTVVVGDVCSQDYYGNVTLYTTVIIKYVGDNQPNVIVREGVDVQFNKVG